MVYLTDPETADQDGEAVRRLFRGAEGIAAVLGPEDFASYHLPRPDEHRGMADLILAARAGYVLSGEAMGDAFVVPNEGTTGAHGYLSTEPVMNAVFVASGAGIKAGAPLGTVDNTDVAPTVARLLGVAPDRASGRDLAEILVAHERGRGVEWIAHRGESADAPENTLAAFRLAWERGDAAIELDVHRTRDGALIVSHDADTRRTTGTARLIKDSNRDQLQSLDAGRWKGASWAGERLPLLDEALATVPPEGRCFIEVKVGPEAVPALQEAVRDSGKRPGQLAIISFQAETVAEAKRRLPTIEAYYLARFHREEGTGRWRPGPGVLIEQAVSIGADGLDLSSQGPIDRDFVRRVKSAGLKLYVWTVDDPSKARELIEAGVDGITTNKAAWMEDQLREVSILGDRQGSQDHPPGPTR